MNGLNPLWNETFTFELHHPELTLLLISVRDNIKFSKDDTVAYCALRVSPTNSIIRKSTHIYRF